jgi:hypothetical protein
MFLVEEYLRFYRFSLPAPCRIRVVHNGSKRQLSFLPSTGYSKRSKTTHLCATPRFSTEVGNIVVEFGGAAQQDTLDRYLNGQQVSYTDLRRVWTDVVGWIPTVTGLGYANFFAQVRAVNLGLPPDRRIHVWLGEPPIDWSKIETKDDFQPFLAQRDTHAADVIENASWNQGRKQ